MSDGGHGDLGDEGEAEGKAGGEKVPDEEDGSMAGEDPGEETGGTSWKADEIGGRSQGRFMRRTTGSPPSV